MRKQYVVLILIWGILAGCSNAALCGDDEPETVVVDAAAYATPGSEIEVCIFPADEPANADCNPVGYSSSSVTWLGDYPEIVDYTVMRTNADGTVEMLAAGTYRLQCEPGTVRIELGTRPDQ
ncbi:MAG: hypothetical protein WBV06_09685 [Acidimicrobiia bacterium]